MYVLQITQDVQSNPIGTILILRLPSFEAPIHPLYHQKYSTERQQKYSFYETTQSFRGRNISMVHYGVTQLILLQTELFIS